MNAPLEQLDFKQGLVLMSGVTADLACLTSLRGKVEEQFFRRLCAHILFATLDAYAHILKSITLNPALSQNKDFSPKVLRVLQEGSWEGHDRGEKQWKPYYPGTRENIRVTIRAFASACEIETPLASDFPFPPGFDFALGVRNRITHPKRPDDFNIADVERDHLAATLQWTISLVTWAKERQVDLVDRLQGRLNQARDETIESLKCD